MKTPKTAADALELLRSIDHTYPDSEATAFIESLKELSIEDRIEFCVRSQAQGFSQIMEQFKYANIAIDAQQDHLQKISEFLKPQNYGKDTTKQ